jgi:hypothetical protein
MTKIKPLTTHFPDRTIKGFHLRHGCVTSACSRVWDLARQAVVGILCAYSIKGRDNVLNGILARKRPCYATASGLIRRLNVSSARRTASSMLMYS